MGVYSQVLTVMPSEASSNNELKLRSLLNHLQDVASRAVIDLEGAPSQLMARGYAWVLLRYELELIRRLPSMDESFRVKTCHDMRERYHTLRVFQAETLDGEPLLWAKTSWLLLDLATGRPARPGERLPDLKQAARDDIDARFKEIPELGTPTREVLFPVRFHDLDPNGHANNAVYFEWAFEAAPVDPHVYGIREMSALFRKGARYGDIVTARVAELPRSSGKREFVCEIMNEESVKPLACLSSVWERRES